MKHSCLPNERGPKLRATKVAMGKSYRFRSFAISIHMVLEHVKQWLLIWASISIHPHRINNRGTPWSAICCPRFVLKVRKYVLCTTCCSVHVIMCVDSPTLHMSRRQRRRTYFFMSGDRSTIHACRVLTPDYGRRDSRTFCNQLACFGYPSNWPLGASTGRRRDSTGSALAQATQDTIYFLRQREAWQTICCKGYCGTRSEGSCT